VAEQRGMPTARIRFGTEAFLSEAGAGRTVLSCRKGDVIFAQGDRADAVYFVRSGRIKLSVVSPRGREGVIAVVGTGAFVGEQCLTPGAAPRQATASALTDSTVVCIARDAMRHVLRTDAAFATRFMAYVLDRNTRVEEDLVNQLCNSSEQRLARILLLLADFTADPGTGRIAPRISQETLAEMVGTTRSRVSFFMNRFRRLGAIEYGDDIEVRASLLGAIAGDLPFPLGSG
jgi:CRP-like cAMP-binding protein